MEAKHLVPTIGLEIHVALKTESKMFCSCKNDPDEERPNVNVCPICLGHPGSLPVINEAAVKHVISVGHAIGGSVADFTEWDRKNYFYPDIPKGYQISQYAYPLVRGGSLSGVAIERVHLEEDTAGLTHDTHERSLINFNRSGVPLMELVTTPSIRDAAGALLFARELRLLLRYLGAADADMEKGGMRIEANLSLSSADDLARKKFGTKTEIKNLNSFRSLERAIAYEIDRQTSLLDSGSPVVQETRGWDDRTGETYSQRSKESSHDYRYFPEPDIPKMKISEIPAFDEGAIRKSLPELPQEKRDRFKKDFKMTDKEVAVMIDEPLIAEYFESVADRLSGDVSKIRLAVNYILTDYISLVSPRDLGTISPEAFGDLITMISDGSISSRGAKDLLALLVKEKGGSPKELAAKHGLIQKSDEESLIPAVDMAISKNASVVAEYKKGKTASLQFLIGQVMKSTKGAANPEVVKKLLVKKLS